MIAVNRTEFMYWAFGRLVDFTNGRGVVGDNVDHKKAKEALDRGEQIVLLVKNKPTTIMQKINNAYTERMIKNEKMENRDIQIRQPMAHTHHIIKRS